MTMNTSTILKIQQGGNPQPDEESEGKSNAPNAKGNSHSKKIAALQQKKQPGFNAERHQDMLSMRDTLMKVYDKFKTEHAEGHSFALLEKRLQDVNVRGYYAKLIFDYIQHKHNIKVTQKEFYTEIIPFILEVVITIQYYHNQVLDGKAGKTDMDTALNNIKEANLLKPFLYKFIENKINNKRDVDIVKNYVSQMFYYVDLGQYIEKTGNRISGYKENKGYKWTKKLENLVKDASSVPFIQSPSSYCHSDECIYSEKFQESLLVENIRLQQALCEFPLVRKLAPQSHKLAKGIISSSKTIKEVIRSSPSDRAWFMELYFKRISLTCGALFVMATKMILQLIGLSENGKVASELIAFSKCFGVMRQVVNDNVDWAPSYLGLSTKTKDAEDAFSDLKNGNTTLPLISHLRHKRKDVIHNYLKGEIQIDEQVERALYDTMIDSGALKDAIKIGRGIHEEAVSFLDKKNPATAYLTDMSKIALNNKYYHCFYLEIKRQAKIKKAVSSEPVHKPKDIAALITQSIAWLGSWFNALGGSFVQPQTGLG